MSGYIVAPLTVADRVNIQQNRTFENNSEKGSQKVKAAINGIKMTKGKEEEKKKKESPARKIWNKNASLLKNC